MRLYRVLRNAYARYAFDGEGAFRFGGRWSSPGVRLVYTSEHQSLAMLEYFVHLDADDPPADLILATVDFPDDLPLKQITPSELPARWRQTPAPPSLTKFGDEFVTRGEHVALVVPSAVAPAENNWLLNPVHPDFKHIRIRPHEALEYDLRMFDRGLRRRKQK